MKSASRLFYRSSIRVLRDTVLLWGVRIGGLMDDTLCIKVVLETVVAKLPEMFSIKAMKLTRCYSASDFFFINVVCVHSL